MYDPVCYTFQNQHFWLSADRVIFWEEQKTLIASDLHLGKTGHFRKNGIAVPQAIFKEDIQRLVAALTFYKAEHLLVVGDMFHSAANKELDLFTKWRNDFSQLQITLVKGNHDILKPAWYANANITIHEGHLVVDGIGFQHDIADTGCQMKDVHYTFCGHLHPGISLNGNGRQHLFFPCFYFGNSYAVLPAFSEFSGLAAVKPKKGETVFAIVQHQLVRLKK